MKKFLLLFLFFLGIGMLLLFKIDVASTIAGSDDAYVNIWGSSYINPPCNVTDSKCQNYFGTGLSPSRVADCNLLTGTCNGKSKDGTQSNWYVYKAVCTGYDSSFECGGHSSLPYAVPEQWSQPGESLNIFDGEQCGETIQLDVFETKCRKADGSWDDAACDDPHNHGYIDIRTPACPATTTTATETPTASVTQGPACGMTCSTDQDCATLQSCTSCINGSCQPPTATPTATLTPTPTPTPTFNPAMCACDGTTVSSLVPGTQATVTSNYQIVGDDQSKATLKNITFTMYKGDNTTGTPILHSDPIPVTITSLNNTRTQYQAQWTFTVPTDVDPNIVYRIMTSSDCQASGLTQTSMNVQVAGVSTGPTSQPKKQTTNLWSSITGFFKSLFGLNNQAASTSTVSNTPTPTKEPIYTVQGNQIQIGKMTPPASMLPQTACNILRFQFGQ